MLCFIFFIVRFRLPSGTKARTQDSQRHHRSNHFERNETSPERSRSDSGMAWLSIRTTTV